MFVEEEASISELPPNASFVNLHMQIFLETGSSSMLHILTCCRPHI